MGMHFGPDSSAKIISLGVMLYNLSKQSSLMAIELNNAAQCLVTESQHFQGSLATKCGGFIRRGKHSAGANKSRVFVRCYNLYWLTEDFSIFLLVIKQETGMNNVLWTSQRTEIKIQCR